MENMIMKRLSVDKYYLNIAKAVAARSEMIGATLYLYGEENGKSIDSTPCPVCSRLIKNAGIIKVICNDKC